MAMQKTLFKKYLRVSLAIILVSFLLLGVMLIVFMSRYWPVSYTHLDVYKRQAHDIKFLIGIGGNQGLTDDQL